MPQKIFQKDKILNRPNVCSQPDLFIEHLSKAEVHFLALRCLNLYSLKRILLNFRPVLLGAPLQLGARAYTG